MELPDVRHGQPALLFLTPARGLCPTDRGCSNGALSQGEVGGRCVSAGGMHRTSPGGSFCRFAPRGDGRIAPAREFCGDCVLN